MTHYTISDGKTSSGLVLSAHDTLTVINGGAKSTRIESGATASLLFNGFAISSLIEVGGVERVSGFSIHDTIEGAEVASSGGWVQSAKLESGGRLYVLSGGRLDDTVIEAGGNLIVSSGARLSNVRVAAGAIASGFSISGSGSASFPYQPPAYAGLNVLSGGIATAIVVESGGEIAVQTGGRADADVLRRGWVAVSEGGEANDIVVSSGGVLLVSRGGIASGTEISSGGEEIVSGTAEATRILSGGLLSVLAGVTTGVSFASGGVLSESSQGLVSGLAVTEGAVVDIGGRASSDTVLAHGLETVVDSKAIDVGAVVERLGELVVESGIAKKTLVSAGGSLVIGSHGSGGDITVDGVAMFSGSVSDVTISSGGIVYADKGNTGAVTVMSGAHLVASADVSDVVEQGGVLLVASHGGATTMLHGREIVYGDEWGLTAESGGVSIIEHGGLLFGGSVRSGGELLAMDGATVGHLNDMANTFAVSAGGLGVLDHGATALMVRVAGGHLVQNGRGVSNTVVAGGQEIVQSGGVESAFAVSSGGALIVSSAGRVSGLNVNANGSAAILSGGSVTLEIVQNQFFWNGGIGAHGEVAISEGGRLLISGQYGWVDGAIGDDGVITVMGSQTLGGSLSGSGVVAIDAAHVTMSDAGAAFAGEVLVSSGALVLSTYAALGSASIHFAGGALEVASAAEAKSGATFENALVNFDGPTDSIDLVGAADYSDATAVVSAGYLLLTDGGYSTRFALEGSVASSYTVSDDGSGGTLIVAGQAAALSHAMAALRTTSVEPLTRDSAAATFARTLFAVPSVAAHRAL